MNMQANIYLNESICYHILVFKINKRKVKIMTTASCMCLLEQKRRGKRKKNNREKSEYSYESESESDSGSESDMEPAPPGMTLTVITQRYRLAGMLTVSVMQSQNLQIIIGSCVDRELCWLLYFAVHAFMLTPMLPCVFACIWCTSAQTCMHIHLCIHGHTHTNTHTCMHARTHTRQTYTRFSVFLII